MRASRSTTRPRAGYFARLGVSHLYLSPVATAEPGSRHGYDTVDYGTLTPKPAAKPVSSGSSMRCARTGWA